MFAQHAVFVGGPRGRDHCIIVAGAERTAILAGEKSTGMDQAAAIMFLWPSWALVTMLTGPWFKSL
jgi:hypothetical protein